MVVESPGKGQDGHRLRFCLHEDGGAFGQRASRGSDIIHQEDPPAGDLLRFPHREGLPDVCRPLLPSQTDLRRGEELPPERHEIQREREPLRYLACQDHGLVKTPLPKAFPVQRNRYDQGKNRHIPFPAGKIGHDSPQDLTDPDSSPILEEVDRRQERFFVQSDSPGDRIGPLGCEALPAEVVFPFCGGKGDAASGAAGGTDEADPRRTGGAEGEGSMLLQDGAAGNAKGREDQVGDPGQDLFHGYISLVSAFRVTVSSGTSIRSASDQSLSRS